MAVTSLTRFTSSNRDAFLAAAKNARDIFERSGGRFRVGQIYSGAHVGQWLATLTYDGWEHYGRAMQMLSADSAYQSMMAEVAAVSQIADRTFVVEIDV